ncbi:hypothetical protein A2G96_26785 [Cupriavidus nantongensis]|uniref:Uncharacterized protein n=2 Tax=Cupriavidus nantongensis TaxID=1796606 RepID=A0A142JTJ5_9BURK|nr:hypothetical protein A2G96_26785 [Cupriavidus nantongensis]
MTSQINWDVGLWVKWHYQGYFSHTQTVGHWRMASTFATTVGTLTNFSIAERNRFDNCLFQGYRGLAIRSSDLCPITSVSDSAVEIP